MAEGPLAGFRILDLTQVVSGPFCTMLLGELGADIIKIESPEGDSMRSTGIPKKNGVSASFVNFNRNKRSVVIDIKQDQGRDLVRRLAVRADAMIENNRPGVADRLGIGYADIRRANNKIVYCSICGYRPQRAGLPTFPRTIRSSRLTPGWLTYRPARPPSRGRCGRRLRTRSAGMTAALSIVSALHAARARGVGQYIRVPMVEAMIAFTANDTIYGYTFFPEEEFKHKAPKTTSLDPFKTKDGWIAIAPFTDAQFERLCAAAGHPEWWTSVSDRLERARGVMRGLARAFPRKKHRRLARGAGGSRHPLRAGA